MANLAKDRTHSSVIVRDRQGSRAIVLFSVYQVETGRTYPSLNFSSGSESKAKPQAVQTITVNISMLLYTALLMEHTGFVSSIGPHGEYRLLHTLP